MLYRVGGNLYMSASKWIEATKMQESQISQLREKLKRYEKPDDFQHGN